MNGYKTKLFRVQPSFSCPKSKSILNKLNGNGTATQRPTMCPLKGCYVLSWSSMASTTDEELIDQRNYLIAP